MSKTQVNVRLEKELNDEVNSLVKNGYFSSKTEVFTEALKLLIRSRTGELLASKIDHIREGTESYPSLSESVVSAHEEEDERLG